ncbi:MAG: Gfo/Idh/MocA family oxidoreductase [Rhodocyclaceae bacterium]
MKSYALVGTGGRSGMFLESIARDYSATARVVALCDTNSTRMAYGNSLLAKHGHAAAATFKAEQFDQMVRDTQPDVVIVCSIDRTHHHYIIRAMELGCDVITEKPMTIDAEKCQAIIDTVERTGRNLRVAFNYRYAPHHTKLRELVRDGVIGNVLSVHFEWLLNTQHGADYFRRWHRDKRNSGGLLVHKSTHHFDLVNFWLNTSPETVYAQGGLQFYGQDNAEARGVTKFYPRTHGYENAKGDPFALDMAASEQLKSLYLEAEQEDGYIRDQSVFSHGINIEDTLGLVVRYRNKAVMTYSLNAYLPWEGFNVALNGTAGRIEMKVIEKSYVNAGGSKADEGALKWCEVTVYPMFDAPYRMEIAKGEGGHGGGDNVMLEEMFGEAADDPFKRAANYRDGAMSILTGIAGNLSLQTGQAVRIDDLPVHLPGGQPLR